jgi:hypothetical protein
MMTDRTSKTVREEINALYALLATAAAKKAVGRIENHDDAAGANVWAERASNWLIKSGAHATRSEYRKPGVAR